MWSFRKEITSLDRCWVVDDMRYAFAPNEPRLSAQIQADQQQICMICRQEREIPAQRCIRDVEKVLWPNRQKDEQATFYSECVRALRLLPRKRAMETCDSASLLCGRCPLLPVRYVSRCSVDRENTAQRLFECWVYRGRGNFCTSKSVTRKLLLLLVLLSRK